MTNNQLTVNGPEICKPVYLVETRSLENNTLFELPTGRWGAKLRTGAVIFGDNAASTWIGTVSLDELSARAELKFCRKLPGKLEITYRA